MSEKTGSQITRIPLARDPELRREVMLSLKQTRYFAAINHEILEEVLSESYLLRLKADDVLIEEGSEKIDTFFFLRNGSVGVYVDGLPETSRELPNPQVYESTWSSTGSRN